MIDENKADFVKKFCKLIRENTREYSDIKDITYVVDEHNDEFIYVTYASNAQRRVRITADSCSAIMVDFLNKINHAEWVPTDERIIPSTTDIDFFDELRNTYDVEDFTGYIGTTLDEHAKDEDIKASRQFLEKVYLIAANYL